MVLTNKDPEVEMVILDDERPLFLAQPPGMQVIDISTLIFQGREFPVNIVKMPSGDQVPALAEGFRDIFIELINQQS